MATPPNWYWLGHKCCQQRFGLYQCVTTCTETVNASPLWERRLASPLPLPLILHFLVYTTQVATFPHEGESVVEICTGPLCSMTSCGRDHSGGSARLRFVLMPALCAPLPHDTTPTLLI